MVPPIGRKRRVSNEIRALIHALILVAETPISEITDVHRDTIRRADTFLDNTVDAGGPRLEIPGDPSWGQVSSRVRGLPAYSPPGGCAA